MNKKISSYFVVFLMVILSINVFSLNTNLKAYASNTEEINVIDLNFENDKNLINYFSSIKKDSNKTAIKMNKNHFEKLSIVDLNNKIDNNIPLLIIDDGIKSKEIENKFDVKKRSMEINNCINLGYAVYKNNDEIEIENISVAYLVTEKQKNIDISLYKPDKDKVINTYLKDNVNKFFKKASIQNNINNEMQTVSSNQDYINLNADNEMQTMSSFPTQFLFEQHGSISLTLVPSTEVYGSAQITNYIYDVCRISRNGNIEHIWDVYSSVTVNVVETAAIKNFKVRMHSNVVDEQCIDASFLESEVDMSYTTGYSIGGSINTEGCFEVSGNYQSTTSYTYNSSSMEIINIFLEDNVKYWQAVPASVIYNASRQLRPGIRFINRNSANAAEHWNGAFTRLEDLTFERYWHNWLGTHIYETHTLYEGHKFEVGEWWWSN